MASQNYRKSKSIKYINMYFPFADLSLITLVEDASADNKLVGIGITLPSLSEALQKCKKGRLFPIWLVPSC